MALKMASHVPLRASSAVGFTSLTREDPIISFATTRNLKGTSLFADGVPVEHAAKQRVLFVGETVVLGQLRFVGVSFDSSWLVEVDFGLKSGRPVLVGGGVSRLVLEDVSPVFVAPLEAVDLRVPTAGADPAALGADPAALGPSLPCRGWISPDETAPV